MLSYLSSLPISVLRSLDTEINTFYDRTNLGIMSQYDLMLDLKIKVGHCDL